ncbi:hypothetical protein ACO0SA_003796 [Hanseniaspora valbyensis]
MAVNHIPNTYLRSIVLTCQTTLGPLIIYNYPPCCTVKNKTASNTTSYNNEEEYLDNNQVPFNINDSLANTTTEEYDIFQTDPNNDLFSNSLDTNNNLENSFKDISLMGSTKLEKELSNNNNNNNNNHMESSDMSDGSAISTDYANYSSDASSIITDNDESNGGGGASLAKSNNNQINSVKEQQQQQQQLPQPQVKKRSNTVVTGTTIDSNFINPDSPENKIIQEFIDKFPEDKFHFIKDKICGLDKDIIAEYCLPPRHLCNQRFEFTCDELSFIGLPMASKNPDGTWNNIKKNKQEQEEEKEENIDDDFGDDELENESQSDSELAEIKSQTTKKSQSFKAQVGDNIFVFNLVFILDPLLLEYDQRVDEMYDNVATRFAMFLRFFQQDSNYLSKEVTKILEINEQFNNNSGKFTVYNQYKKLLLKSSLCRAITKCFHRISDNKIANLVIDEDKFISLQIPIRNEFKSLPNVKIDHILKGSFLTNIENFKFLSTYKFDKQNMNGKIDDQETSNGGGVDEILNYALIFLMDPQDIINDLNNNVGENDLSTLIMTDLVKTIKPYSTLRSYKKTMQNLIQTYTNESFTDEEFVMKMLKSFVLHFIYWRQARCILPISSKNKYIVSPIGPMTGQSIDDFDTNIHYSKHIDKLPLIYSLQMEFKQQFQLLPVLSTFLTYFNGEDSFGLHIPSKEHKLMYFQGVAWCIKKGLLTQVVTFIYLRVDAKIKTSVEEDLEKEGFLSRNKKNKKDKNQNEINNSNNLLTADSNDQLYDAGKRSDSNKSSDNILSDGIEDMGDTESLLSIDSFEDVDEFTIILDPRTSTAIEKRWLYKLVQNDFKKSEQKLFYRLLKYFNGETSIEYLCVKNGISRNEINQLLKKLGKYVVKVKHW